MPKKVTRTERIIQFNIIHGDGRYNYKLIPDIVNRNMKVPIICEKQSSDGSLHGIFYQAVFSHQSGCGCPKCGGNYKPTTSEFVKKSLSIDEFKNYNYDYFEYKGIDIKGKIFCPKEGHGFFWKTPYAHLNVGEGCFECSKEQMRNIRLGTNDEFINKSEQIHINESGECKYDYSLTYYVDAKTKVKIFCKKEGHGVFEQTPDSHLKGSGCYLCGLKTIGFKKRMTTQEFVIKAQKKHFNSETNTAIYDYTLTNYISSKKKVIIICSKEGHGKFLQKPSKHLFGNGCPICNMSKGEIKIENFFNYNKINFERQKRFIGCKNIKPLPFDFYLPEYNICIEYDGEQHFKYKDCFGGEVAFIEREKYDKIKNDYCKDSNIQLIRIKYTENVDDVLKKELKHIIQVSHPIYQYGT
jgi:hypothetical protein